MRFLKKLIGLYLNYGYNRRKGYTTIVNELSGSSMIMNVKHWR